MILASRIIFTSQANDDFGKVKLEAEKLSDYFLTEGVPSNWTNETVVRIGLLTNNRVDQNKLLQLYNISYEESKLYLGVNNDYLLFFEKNNSIINITRCGYGGITMTNCSINVSSIVSNNLVKITRLTIFNSSIVEMKIYVWN